ncbi:MAG TPA: phenylalanine--tRNA ligase subunit alpha [Thermoanaerobaculia bacterium]|nr:phenylalanine--tRNA ligase subunit alpha [Thermoanaerobaculia bacterium]
MQRARERFDAAAGAVVTRDAWEALRVEWLGRKRGFIRDQEQRLRELPAGDRREFGRVLNELKQSIEAELTALDQRLGTAERDDRERAAAIDVTLPGRRPRVGSVHPVSRVIEEMEQIFLELGFSVAEGPEIEDDFHNFEALNFPPDHPARDSQDTFLLEDGRLLRTHTSPVQIRTMLARKPPIRVICPGRVYRHDNDLRHSPMFHQIEGLEIAEGISFAHLKGTLLAFLRRLFAPDVNIRLRPSFFPFTEPSAEVDVTCGSCRGKGCATCSGTGWMEILGAGMVDPRVLEKCGIDPDRYSGWAFGMGVDRIAMNRYGIPNIRTLFENDVRVLRQVRR